MDTETSPKGIITAKSTYSFLNSNEYEANVHRDWCHILWHTPRVKRYFDRSCCLVDSLVLKDHIIWALAIDYVLFVGFMLNAVNNFTCMFSNEIRKMFEQNCSVHFCFFNYWKDGKWLAEGNDDHKKHGMILRSLIANALWWISKTHNNAIFSSINANHKGVFYKIIASMDPVMNDCVFDGDKVV